MKSKIVTTVAAALIAGVAGLTLAAGASAAPFKLNLSGACAKVNGGVINKKDTGSTSGWSTKLCVLHTVSTYKAKLAFRVSGYAHFNKFKGLKATVANLKRCAKSVVIVSFYKRATSGKWKLVQRVKRNAVPKFKLFGKITKCQADAGTKYAVGGTMYRTIVMAIDGDGKNNGNPIASLIRSKY